MSRLRLSRVAALVTMSGALVACAPKQEASVGMSALDDPAECESQRWSMRMELPRDGECLPRFVVESTVPADDAATREETDEAVLARLAGYSEWRLVNEIRYRQRRWTIEFCMPPPPNHGERCNDPKSNEPFDPDSSEPFPERALFLESQLDPLPPGAGIHVFINQPAEAPMLTQKRPRFPEGSIIVKQKWHDAEQETPDLLTVMIKREKGYNPEVGDWEFLAVSGDAQHIHGRGRLDNCQACHIPRRETDFIIRSYLPHDILVGLE